jgi:hypothetical protein
MWDPQFTFNKPSLQLEEHHYPLETSSNAKRFTHQRQISPSSLNVPVSADTYNSYPSTVPYAPSSAFVRQPSIRTSPFNSLDADANLPPDTSPSSFTTPSHLPHVPPVYNQPRLNPLEPNQAPEGSPHLDPVNHLTSRSYLPAGPMQFPTPLPLPPRQSELQAQYFNAPHVRTQPDSPPSLKRPKNDDYADGHAEQLEAQEQEAARPKPMGACARCKSLKVNHNARQIPSHVCVIGPL